MENRPEAVWAPVVERVALFLAAFGILLRFWINGAIAGPGLNLLIHLVLWIALGLALLSRALGDGFAWRLTGVEVALLAFVSLCLASIGAASYKLVALDQALAYLTCALLFVLATLTLGWNGILSLLFPTFFALALYAVVQRLILFPILEGSPQALALTAESQDFAQRLARKEAISTFLYANAFGGFVALMTPLTLGALIDGREGKPAALLSKGLALGLGGFALLFTKSLGAWVAWTAGLAAFGLLAATRERGRTALVAGGLGVAAVAVLLLAATPLLPWMAARNHSMHVRQVYWQAGLRMVPLAPALGIGLDNYQEFYHQVKPDVQQESRKAHNDYLQILVELGAAGLLAFLGLIGVVLRSALSRETPPLPPPTPSPPWVFPAAAAASLLCAYLLKGVFDGLLLTLLLAGAWVAYALLARNGAAGELRFTRLGAAAGLVAFLVHLTVDFDFYELAAATGLFLLFALLMTLQGKGTPHRASRTAAGAGAGVVLLLSIPLLLWAVPRLSGADARIEEAEAALRRFHARAAGVDTASLDAALKASERAQELNPLDPEGYFLYAKAQFAFWSLLASLADRKEKEAIVIRAMENALALRPQASPYHAAKAGFHRQFQLFYQARPDSRGPAEAHLRLAVEGQREAARLYPTHARVRYELARYLDLSGSRDEAESHYREALRLGDLAGREPENLDRLKLEALPRARALRRTGRPLDGHDVLAAYFREVFRGRGAADVRQAIERFRQRKNLPPALADELDEEMRPVIDDAMNAILSELE